MTKTDKAKGIAEMQDKLGLVAKNIRKDDNAEARRELAFLIGSANSLYDVLAKEYYESL